MDWSRIQELPLEEQIDLYARERENAKRRADYARHPERAVRQRINTYRNFLNRHGKVVLERPPEPPWNALQARAILAALEEAMANE